MPSRRKASVPQRLPGGLEEHAARLRGTARLAPRATAAASTAHSGSSAPPRGRALKRILSGVEGTSSDAASQAALASRVAALSELSPKQVRGLTLQECACFEQGAALIAPVCHFEGHACSSCLPEPRLARRPCVCFVQSGSRVVYAEIAFLAGSVPAPLLVEDTRFWSSMRTLLKHGACAVVPGAQSEGKLTASVWITEKVVRERFPAVLRRALRDLLMHFITSQPDTTLPAGMSGHASAPSSQIAEHGGLGASGAAAGEGCLAEWQLYSAARPSLKPDPMPLPDEASDSLRKFLCPTTHLRRYQTDAVSWMLAREGFNGTPGPASTENHLHPLWHRVAFPVPSPCLEALQAAKVSMVSDKHGQVCIWCNFHEGLVSLAPPPPTSAKVRHHGGCGILADEMGLGKTVVAIACILAGLGGSWPDTAPLTIQVPQAQPPRRGAKRERERASSRRFLVRLKGSATMPAVRVGPALLPQGWLPRACPRPCPFSGQPASPGEVAFGQCRHCCRTVCLDALVEFQPQLGSKAGGHGSGLCLFCESAILSRSAPCGSPSTDSPDLLSSSATLIICPQQLLVQWLEEIRVHVADVSVSPLPFAAGRPPTTRRAWARLLAASAETATRACQHGHSQSIQVVVYPGVGSFLNACNQLAAARTWAQAHQSSAAATRVHLAESMSPRHLAAATIVIATYETLKQEIFRIPGQFRTQQLETPLMKVRWHRVILDEAQLIDAPAAAAARMARQFNARHRWAMSGTPLLRGIEDLRGLCMFLGLQPYDDARQLATCLEQSPVDDALQRRAASAEGAPSEASGLEHTGTVSQVQRLPAQCSSILDFPDHQPVWPLVPTRVRFLADMGAMMWRNTQADVQCELQLPDRIEETLLVQQFPAEREAYLRVLQESRKTLQPLLQRWSASAALGPGALDEPFSQTSASGILSDTLLHVRQVACHVSAAVGVGWLRKQRKRSRTPRAGTSEGSALAETGDVMDQEALVATLVEKATQDCAQAQREAAYAANGQAGIACLLGGYEQACSLYSSVLRDADALEEEFGVRLDTGQRVHAASNLAALAEAYPQAASAVCDVQSPEQLGCIISSCCEAHSQQAWQAVCHSFEAWLGSAWLALHSVAALASASPIPPQAERARLLQAFVEDAKSSMGAPGSSLCESVLPKQSVRHGLPLQAHQLGVLALLGVAPQTLAPGDIPLPGAAAERSIWTSASGVKRLAESLAPSLTHAADALLGAFLRLPTGQVLDLCSPQGMAAAGAAPQIQRKILPILSVVQHFEGVDEEDSEHQRQGRSRTRPDALRRLKWAVTNLQSLQKQMHTALQDLAFIRSQAVLTCKRLACPGPEELERSADCRVCRVDGQGSPCGMCEFKETIMRYERCFFERVDSRLRHKKGEGATWAGSSTRGVRAEGGEAMLQFLTSARPSKQARRADQGVSLLSMATLDQDRRVETALVRCVRRLCLGVSSFPDTHQDFTGRRRDARSPTLARILDTFRAESEALGDFWRKQKDFLSVVDEFRMFQGRLSLVAPARVPNPDVAQGAATVIQPQEVPEHLILPSSMPVVEGIVRCADEQRPHACELPVVPDSDMAEAVAVDLPANQLWVWDLAPRQLHFLDTAATASNDMRRFKYRLQHTLRLQAEVCGVQREDPEGAECPICLETLEEKMNAVLPCSHRLCRECCWTSLRMGRGRSQCPLCKVPFTRRQPVVVSVSAHVLEGRRRRRVQKESPESQHPQAVHKPQAVAPSVELSQASPPGRDSCQPVKYHNGTATPLLQEEAATAHVLSYSRSAFDAHRLMDSISGASMLGSKLSAVVASMLKIAAAPLPEGGQPKCLVFSQWDKLLHILSTGLKMNGLAHAVVHSSRELPVVLQQFQQDPTIRALLLPTRIGNNGLNITEAQHVIFLEPNVDASVERQAIGRVHRSGQTRTTYVHRFLAQGTVEVAVHRRAEVSESCSQVPGLTPRDVMMVFARPAPDAEQADAYASTSITSGGSPACFSNHAETSSPAAGVGL